MRDFKEVEKLMAQLEIPYKIVEHPASHSTEESDHYIEGHEGCRSKTLVLANKKSTQFYMVIMDDSKRVEMNKLGEVLGVNRLHFVSEERLESMLGLQSGMHVYFDRDMLEEHDIMTLHPNDNTKTIFFPMEDCFKILDAQCYTYTIIDI